MQMIFLIAKMSFNMYEINILQNLSRERINTLDHYELHFAKNKFHLSEIFYKDYQMKQKLIFISVYKFYALQTHL